MSRGRLAVVAVLAALAAAAVPGPASAAEFEADPSTLADAYAKAKAGDTIKLGTGDFGVFKGGEKPGMVTLAGAPGGGSRIYPLLTGAANLRFSGLTITAADVVNSRSIEFVGNRFTGMAKVKTGSGTDRRILFDRNTHVDINVCDGCSEGRITVQGDRTSAPNGVKISNSRFSGGNSDGVQISAYGTQVGPGNRFIDIDEVDETHTDAIQLYGSSHTRVVGNYLYSNATGIMAPDGADHEVIEDNVITTNGYPWGIVLGTDDGSVVRNNTLPDGACNWDLRCGTLRIDGGNQKQASRGTVVEANVLGRLAVDGASKLASDKQNLIASGPGAAPPNLAGKPTFTGGAKPASWTGFRLAPGSAGTAAAGGADIGAAVPVPPAATVQEAPSSGPPLWLLGLLPALIGAAAVAIFVVRRRRARSPARRPLSHQ